MRPDRTAARLLVAALGALAVLAAAGPVSADEPRHRTVFRYTDAAITESSGLVARDHTMFTVNDSGAGPQIYAVDPAGGDTVGVTTYATGTVTDVEALAPGARGRVWVGDIGDNRRERDGVDAYRVPMASPRGERHVAADRFRLVYPDGPHDAEALLVHPVTGRLYLVTKAVLGGRVYAAPATLRPHRPNRLRAVGPAPGLVTDGAFYPDGEHLLLRSYGTATVLTFPALREVAAHDLPDQPQGEAVAIDERGRVFLGTEGAGTAVLRVFLPRPANASTSEPVQADAEDPRPGGWRAGEGVLVWVGAAVLVAVFALRLSRFLRASRRRSRRRR